MEPVKAERIPLKRSDGRDAQETTHPTVVVMAVQTSWRGCAQSLSALRFFELVSDDVVAAGCRRAEPTTMNQATSASEARRLDKGQPVPSACKQVAFATNSNSLGIPRVVTYCGWVAA